MDKLLTYLSIVASVVPNFVGLLTRPKAQLRENIRPSEENWSRALVYFAVAMIFAGVVTIKAYNLPDIAWNICITFVVVILFAVLIMLSWRLLRRPLDLAQSTIWCLYSIPTTMIIFIPFNIIAMGTLEPASRAASGAVYAEFYQEHHIVYHSSIVLAFFTLSFVLGLVAASAWFVSAWGVLREVAVATKLRSAAALIIFTMVFVAVLCACGGIYIYFYPITVELQQ